MRVASLSFGITCLLLAGPALAAEPTQAVLCRTAVAAAEQNRRIPDAFLTAIAKVESGRPLNGAVEPWPWTVNAEGAGSFFDTKEQAIAAVRALQARGVHSIDVGCMQVNLMQHPDAFASLEQAFDPTTNANYAAGLLISLFGQFGSWPLAAAAYHSQTPGIGAAYQKQVLAAWAVPDRPTKYAPALTEAVQAAMKTAASVKSPTMMIQATGPAMTVTPAFGHQSGVFAAAQPHAGLPRMNGRSLSSYREIPVRVAAQAPVPPG